MAQLEGKRLAIKKQQKENKLKSLRERVNAGLSAEKLSIHPAWKELVNKFSYEMENRKSRKYEIYDTILEDAVTTDEKIIAVDKIRKINQEMKDFDFFVNYPEREAEEGILSKAELEKLEEDK